MVPPFNNLPSIKRLGALVFVAAVLSLFSFGILWLEYGVLNFGDSDLPPFQPDTNFERAVDAVWFMVTIGAGLLWLWSTLYAVTLLVRALERRMA